MSLQNFNLQKDQACLSRAINVKVSENTKNPFKLVTTSEPLSYGLNADEAQKTINNYLKFEKTGLEFRHLPLNLIPYQMYQDVIAAYIEKGVQVGIGYDFSDADKTVGFNKHISFVRGEGNGLFVIDFYDDNKGKYVNLSIDEIIRSSMKIRDGLWLIGKPENLTTAII